MRLLRIHNLTFHDVPSHGPFPRYAILSHTWITPNSEEVTYQDLVGGDIERYEKKLGWRKIVNMVERVRKENFEYRLQQSEVIHFVWIDTCCINKLDLAEMTEAINCMFKWYQSSHVCYVYLSDVELGEHLNDLSHERSIDRLNALEAALRSCHWIKRGWTLQELIAPDDVQIFDRQWQYLCPGSGDSDEVEVLARVTGIDFELLAPDNASKAHILHDYSIAQRMSWAAGRVTTRPEDQAYSLLGLFDMVMPLHYGEGGQSAFKRLQKEIIRSSADQSIFAWDWPSDANVRAASNFYLHVANMYHQETSRARFLAPSPSCYRMRDHVKPARFSGAAYEVNNLGLEIELRLFKLKTSSEISATASSSPLHDPEELRGAQLGIPPALRSPDGYEGHYGAILDCSSHRFPSNLYILQLAQSSDDKETFNQSGHRACLEIEWLDLKHYLEISRQELVRKRITILRYTGRLGPVPPPPYTTDLVKVYLGDARLPSSPKVTDDFRPVSFYPEDMWDQGQLLLRAPVQDIDLRSITGRRESPALCFKYSPRNGSDHQSINLLTIFVNPDLYVLNLGVSTHDSTILQPPEPCMIEMKPRRDADRRKKETCYRLEPYLLDHSTELHIKAWLVTDTGTDHWAIEATLVESSTQPTEVGTISMRSPHSEILTSAQVNGSALRIASID